MISEWAPHLLQRNYILEEGPVFQEEGARLQLPAVKGQASTTEVVALLKTLSSCS